VTSHTEFSEFVVMNCEHIMANCCSLLSRSPTTRLQCQDTGKIQLLSKDFSLPYFGICLGMEPDSTTSSIRLAALGHVDTVSAMPSANPFEVAAWLGRIALSSLR